MASPIISIRLRTQLSGSACEIVKAFMYLGYFSLTNAGTQVKTSVKRRLPKKGREEGENKLFEVQRVIVFDFEMLSALYRLLAV